MVRKRRLKDIECGYCKKVIHPKNYKTKYCSPKCQNRARRRIRLESPPDRKKCCNCKKIKHFTEFHASRTGHDLLQTWCKKCQKERTRKKRFVSYECESCNQLFSRVAMSRKAEITRKNVCNFCAKRKIVENNGGHSLNYTGTMHFSGRTIGAWKSSAKRRNYKWEISNKGLEQLYDGQRGFCALSGIKMGGNPKSIYRPSIDRKNSKKGYIAGNVQFVCSIINVMKNKLSDDKFIELCKTIADHNN